MKTVPGITYGAMPRAGTKAAILAPPALIVVHATDNTADRFHEAAYAATRTDTSTHWTSCHVYVDETGVLGSVPLDRQAWAAYGWANAHAWHIEMCGRSNAVPEATQRRAAALVKQMCALGGIPAVHLNGPAVRALHDGKRTVGGVAGHGDITAADFDGNTHTDPGAEFDWLRFMAWVNEGTTVSTSASGGVEMAGEADAAFSKPYTGIESWVSGRSWMAQAIEAPLRALKTDVAELRGRAVAGVDVPALAKALANEPTFVDALVRGITAAAEAGAARALEHTHLVVGGPPDGT